MKTYYFVVWQRTEISTGHVSSPSNIILCDVHPVQWAARLVLSYDGFFVTTLLFWAEISEAVAQVADGWVHIES